MAQDLGKLPDVENAIKTSSEKINKRMKNKQECKVDLDKLMQEAGAYVAIDKAKQLMDEYEMSNKEKQLEQLKDEMDKQWTIYKTAPANLREAQRLYYQKSTGKTYDQYQKEQVEELIKKKIENYNNRFNNNVKIANAIVTEMKENVGISGEKTTFNSDALNDILAKLKRQTNKERTEHIDNYKIADRNAYYNIKRTTFLRLINFIIMVILAGLILAYLTIFLYIYGEYKNMEQIKMRMKLFIPPFIIIAFGVGLYVYLSDTIFKLYSIQWISKFFQNMFESIFNGLSNIQNWFNVQDQLCKGYKTTE